jgi:hypothetical protein
VLLSRVGPVERAHRANTPVAIRVCLGGIHRINSPPVLHDHRWRQANNNIQRFRCIHRDVSLNCRLMRSGDWTGDRSLIMEEKKFGNAPKWLPDSISLTRQLLLCSMSPPLFRQSQGIFVIHLDSRTHSNSCTTCITSQSSTQHVLQCSMSPELFRQSVCFVFPL